MDNLEELLKYLPLGTALLIFMGTVHLISYYSFFDVNILYYITFSEILTSFLDVLSVILILVLTFVLLVTLNPFKELYTHIEDKLMKQGIKMSLINIIIIAFISNTIYYLKKYGIDNHNSVYIYIVFFGLVVITPFALLPIVSSKNNSIKVRAMIYLFCIILIIIISLGKESAYNVHKKGIVDMEIYIDTERFGTNDSLRFIGKTENYLFLYDKSMKKTTIINTENIDKIIERTIDVR